MWLYFINKVTYQRAKINDGNIFKAGIWSYESKKAELSKSAVHKSIAWEGSRHYWSISHFYTTFVFVLCFCSITYYVNEMANQFYFSVWKLLTSLRFWMNKDNVNLWDPKNKTRKSLIVIFLYQRRKNTNTFLSHSLSCHNWGNKAKTLHSHTYSGPYPIHSPGTSGAVYRRSQCPPALLFREGEMQSESMKLHVPAYFAWNGSSAGSVKEPRCFF